MASKNRIRDNQQVSVQQKLHDSQARLAGIISSAMDAIITIDENQKIVLFNKAAEKMFGYSAEQIMNAQLDHLIPERYRPVHEQHIHQFGETGVTNRSMGKMNTLLGVRSNGEEFPIEASISQIQIAGGKLFSVILRDVTERIQADLAIQARNDEIKTMTQQLWQAAKLATMGELAASIAHELNNPLAILSMRVELLIDKLPQDLSEQKDLAVMQQEIDRMANLVSNLLQFSRSGQRQISSLDIRDEIERTLELIANHLANRRIKVVQIFSPHTPMIQADRQQMRQLFLNLFSNASDAMPQGGTLSIKVKPDEKNGKVSIETSDTGIGIDTTNLNRVMDPFFSTKTEGKGTGLGLAICRRIIEEHQGTIQISSPGKDQGATIKITLPSASANNSTFVLDEAA